MLYILNEKEYIRNILASKNKPDDLSMGYFITLIAKYYYSDDLDIEGLSHIVKKTLLDFHLKNYQEYTYHTRIISICGGLLNGEIEKQLKEKEYIPIYENELALINSLKNDRQKKLMFTLFAVARYMECDGWINKKNAKDILEIFRLANVTLPPDRRNELLHELYADGHVSFGKKVDNLNIRVCLNDTGAIVYKVTAFNNVGNQYIGSFKKGYRQCKCCGKNYKIKSDKDFSSKYCAKCAVKKHLESDAAYHRKARKA